MTRVIFFGTPEFAVPSLNALIEAREDVVSVVSQPDRPKGRGRVIRPSPIKELALKHGIPVLHPERIRDKVFIQGLRDLTPDLIIVVAYGKILPKEILEIPPLGCVNLHASLLPWYRGAAPINWVIIKGEKETGVTTILMDEGMDTGPILLSERVFIRDEETAGELAERLADVGAGLLLRTIEGVRSGSIKPIPQDHSQATYAPLLKKEDGHIDWGKGTEDIRNLVRGMSPWPGAYTYWQGRRMNIYKGRIKGDGVKDRPGTVLRASLDGIEVATGRGIFVITELQPEGKRRMGASDFIRGHSVEEGDILD